MAQRELKVNWVARKKISGGPKFPEPRGIPRKDHSGSSKK